MTRLASGGGPCSRSVLSAPRTAFTLIELLVVISIIALLIGLLLPALTRAREAARASACLSNQKQLSLAFFNYADSNGCIPGISVHGPLNLDWSGRNNARYLQDPNRYRHPMETSVLWPFVSKLDKVVECPTGQRKANTVFDYCMVARLAGARTDLHWMMVYPSDPANFNLPMRPFSAIPLLVEEDEEWYNDDPDDGTWAWYDQFTDRHARGANLAFLDGSAGRFVSPKGPIASREEVQDLKAQHLRLRVGDREYSVYHWWPTDTWGWINHPL